MGGRRLEPMETYTTKILSQTGSVPLKLINGHFATNHSHINCYLDMTTLKTRQSEAELAAQALVQHYLASTIVDTILCLDGTQIIGAYLAQELSRAGFVSINAHQTIYVITPEHDANGQMIFRDNLQPMVRDKHVLILPASVTTGISARKAMECVQYYGGTTVGVAAIFSALDQVEGMPIQSVFGPEDIPGYSTYATHDCPLCKANQKLDALVNGYGYSKL